MFMLLWEKLNHREESLHDIFVVSIVVFTVLWYLWLLKKSRTKSWALPPGPTGLPLVGNLPFLEPDLHRYLAKLAQTYGPIMKLQLGNKLCIVLTSPSVVKEALKNQSTIFANRDMPAALRPLTYGGSDLVFAPYGPHWRMVRKVCVKEIMSNTSLDAWYDLRRREVHRTVQNVHAKADAPINVADQVFVTSLNVITRMLWGGTLTGEEHTRVISEFRPLVEDMVRIASRPNVSDFFPVLRRFDIQGLERQMAKKTAWLDQIFDAIIAQRRTMKRRGEGDGRKMECNDFLDLLLQLENDGDDKTAFNTTHIKALLTDIVLASIETTSTTLEWAMAELMEHPNIMKKVQEELELVVGMSSIVEESHLSKLHYLNAILKEVLRLHPSAPFLLPRCSSQSCEIGGYTVPKGCQVLINAWAIQRDPQSWDKPLEFQPERFLCASSKWDFNGTDFRYIPFGSGRRICAGIPLAEKMLMHVLASLLHSFEWRLPEGIKFDLSEKFGIVVKKAKPLIAIPKPRLSNAELYA